MNTKTESHSTELHATIKLGIDVQAKWFDVARQIDGAIPLRVLKMNIEKLLRFAAKQPRRAREIFTCYEQSGVRLTA